MYFYSKLANSIVVNRLPCPDRLEIGGTVGDELNSWLTRESNSSIAGLARKRGEAHGAGRYVATDPNRFRNKVEPPTRSDILLYSPKNPSGSTFAMSGALDEGMIVAKGDRGAVGGKLVIF